MGNDQSVRGSIGDEITFAIPEHVAWGINELAQEEDYSWACFAPSLAGKLNDLCRSIV